MKRITEFQIYGNQLNFSEDVEKYFMIWRKWSIEKVELLKGVSNIMESNIGNDNLYAADIISFVIEGLNITANKLLKEYVDRGIYDITVENILENTGANEKINLMVNDFQKFVDDDSLYIDEMKFDLNNSYFNAQSKVTGNDFGVWADTVGISSYLISDYFVTRKQINKAQSQLDSEQRMITKKFEDTMKTREIEFTKHIYDSCIILIFIFYNEIFERNIQLLIDINEIEESIISTFDFKKSNDILTNIEYAKDKRDVIIQAIKAFPGNLEIYNMIAKYGLGFSKIGNFMQFFSVKEAVIIQMENEIKLLISNNSVKDSLEHNKNILDFIANVNNVDIIKYYKIVYQEKYWSIKEKFNSLVEMIKANEIPLDKLAFTEASSRDERVLKPLIIKYLIGDIDEIIIFKNDLGYSNLDKELCLLIGETDCKEINEIIAIYIEYLYKITIKMLNEEDERKKQKEIEEENNKKKNIKDRNKNIALICLLIVIPFVAYYVIYNNLIVPQNKYNKAAVLTNNGEYDEATQIYTEIADFKDSQQQLLEVKYINAQKLVKYRRYMEAVELYTELGNYKDSEMQLLETKYIWAKDAKISEAIKILSEIKGYKDSEDLLNEYNYKRAVNNMRVWGELEVAKELLQELGDYKDASTLLDTVIKYVDYSGKLLMVNNQDGTIVDSSVSSTIKINDNSIKIIIIESLSNVIIEGIINKDGTIIVEKVQDSSTNDTTEYKCSILDKELTLSHRSLYENWTRVYRKN